MITPRGVVQTTSHQQIRPYNRNKAPQIGKQHLLSVIPLQEEIVSLPDCIVCPNLSPSISESILFPSYLNVSIASWGEQTL